jgi:hypothetical protein
MQKLFYENSNTCSCNHPAAINSLEINSKDLGCLSNIQQESIKAPESNATNYNPSFNSHSLHSTLDKIATVLSLSCALHCLLLPFVLGILPLVGLSFLAHSTAEKIFVGLSIALAIFSICWGHKKHGKTDLFIILALSLAAIITGFFLFEEGEHILLFLGACGIATCHIINRKLCASCKTCLGTQ